MPEMDVPKYISAGLASAGALALVASGYLTLTTPEGQQCQINLADQRARLELMTERVKILTDATDACKTALQSCRE